MSRDRVAGGKRQAAKHLLFNTSFSFQIHQKPCTVLGKGVQSQESKTNPGQTESCARFLTMFMQNDDQQHLIKWKWETTPAQIRAPLTTKILISWRYRRYLPAWLRVCMAGVGNHQQSRNQLSLCTSLIIQRTPMDTVCLLASNQPESHHERRQKKHQSVCTRRTQKPHHFPTGTRTNTRHIRQFQQDVKFQLCKHVSLIYKASKSTLFQACFFFILQLNK